MNFETIYSNPEVVKTLTDKEKTEVYQNLVKDIDKHTQEKIRINMELEIKRAEQLSLFNELKSLTGKDTLEEIDAHLSKLKVDFDTILIDTIEKLNTLDKTLNGEV